MSRFLKSIIAILLLSVVLVMPLACPHGEVESPVEQVTPAEFEISSLVITPTEVAAGQSVEVTATVKNVGGKPGVYNATLWLGNRDVESQEIMLAPEESKLISFTLVEVTPGTYQVRVGGLEGAVCFTEPVVPPNQAVKKLGEQTYILEQNITLKNDGPGEISRMILKLALVVSRYPYQTVVSTNINPSDYKMVTDEYQNSFAEFEYTDVEIGEEVSVKVVYEVVLAELGYDLTECAGSAGEDFLQPERFIESDDPEILALSNQITADKLDACAKARALYDWVGDNISYSGYIYEDKGAVWTLNNGGGDCNEFTYLLIALCRAEGIPARFVEGIGYQADITSSDEFRHGWLEVYLPDIGWMPIDPTWGRFNEKREQYFAHMSPDHIVFTTGNPFDIGRSMDIDVPFHFLGWRWWWPDQEAEVSCSENYEVKIVS